MLYPNKLHMSNDRVCIPLRSTVYRISTDNYSWTEMQSVKDFFCIFLNKERLNMKYFKVEFLNRG